MPVHKRNKFFNYFYIVHDDWFVTMAHINLGIVRGSFVNARNLKTGKIEEVKINDFCSD